MLGEKKFAAHPFGARFRELLKGADEQKLVEDLRFTSPSAFRQWTNGYTLPTCDNLEKLARYFHVTADYLLGLSENAKPENQIVGEELGLTDETITALKRLPHGVASDVARKRYRLPLPADFIQSYALNAMLSNGKFRYILFLVGQALEYYTGTGWGRRNAQTDEEQKDIGAAIETLRTEGYLIQDGKEAAAVYGQMAANSFVELIAEMCESYAEKLSDAEKRRGRSRANGSGE